MSIGIVILSDTVDSAVTGVIVFLTKQLSSYFELSSIVMAVCIKLLSPLTIGTQINIESISVNQVVCIIVCIKVFYKDLN